MSPWGMRDEGAGHRGKGAFLGLPRAQSALHVREAQVAGQVSSAPQPPGPAPWQRALASCWQMPVSAGLTLSLRKPGRRRLFRPSLGAREGARGYTPVGGPRLQPEESVV